MKKFFTTTFACVLGTLIAGLLLIVVGIFAITGMVAATTSQSEVEYIPEPNTVLKLKLSGSLNERYTEDPMATLFAQGETPMGLDQVRRAIEVAGENENIVGIVIDAQGSAIMPASMEEIRRLLAEFKETGKWIYAYADNYTQGDYLIASVADSLILNKIGSIDVHGLGGIQMFYPGLLEKLGVEMQVFRVGTYKSAVEPYICEKMSDANREQTLAYINTIWDENTQAITASRNITAEQLNEIANSITSLRPAEELLAMNLADTLMYRPEFNEWMKTKVGIEADKEVKYASVAELASVAKPANESENIVAVVYAVGEIAESGGEGINSDDLVPELTKLKNDDKVKAIVLRVNSPGGSAYASEQIWAEVEAIKATGKKVVVSMGDLAASGGYYISCNADYIFAENTTLTGSIGVFGLVPSAEELMTKKLGLSFDAVRTHKYGSPLSGEFLYQKFGNAEAMAMQRYVEDCYDLFTRRCANGRSMEQDDIKKIAEGRVWVGKTAVELGLVDEIGGIDDAIAYAAQVSELENYRTANYPKQKTSFELLMEQLGGNVRLSIASALMGEDLPYLKALRQLEHHDPVQCRMEYIEIR